MTQKDNPAAYIEPLHINGMNGRMLHLPARSKKTARYETLMVYGHHSTLERWWGLAQNLNDFGAVVMPDLPGFGGMDSFYRIGRRATLDDYADYMAAFIKMRYRRRRVSIVAVSYGFLVITRMLQRYPELAPKIDYLVSAAGYMRHDNFVFSRHRQQAYVWFARAFRRQPLLWVFRHVLTSGTVLRAAYARTHNAKHKFAAARDDAGAYEAMMDMEVHLWRVNDARTHLSTTVDLLTVDNCTVPINIPVWHVFTPNDNYFDNGVVEQQMRVVFSDYHGLEISTASHVPSVIATKAEAAVLVPPKLRRLLAKRT